MSHPYPATKRLLLNKQRGGEKGIQFINIIFFYILQYYDIFSVTFSVSCPLNAQMLLP